MYINIAMIYGNLTRDPELRALPNGGSVASFSIATNRSFKKADGTRAEQTEFHNIIVFGKQAESCATYLRKGSSAYVEGRLQTRSWETNDGQRRQRTEIVAERVQFGPRPKSAGDGVDDANYASAQERPADARIEGNAGAKEYPQEDIDLDKIPF